MSLLAKIARLMARRIILVSVIITLYRMGWDNLEVRQHSFL